MQCGCALLLTMGWQRRSNERKGEMAEMAAAFVISILLPRAVVTFVVFRSAMTEAGVGGGGEDEVYRS